MNDLVGGSNEHCVNGGGAHRSIKLYSESRINKSCLLIHMLGEWARKSKSMIHCFWGVSTNHFVMA